MNAPTAEETRLLFARPWLFEKGCVRVADLPADGLVEVAFAGRSNVGKSSLINALVGHSGLARTSNTPGRTQELNLFLPQDGSMRIVDMPGYGFAQAPKPAVEKWTRLIHQYLRGRATLRRVYVLVDARHGLKANDTTVMNELDTVAVNYQVVLTKADKPGATDLEAVVRKVQGAIVKRPAAHPEVLVTSSETGGGIEALRAELSSIRAGL